MIVRGAHAVRRGEPPDFDGRARTSGATCS